MSYENGEVASLPQEESAVEEQSEKRIGCAHYKRRAKFVTPCCNKLYMCRYCHDENEQHYFNRKTVTELICTECDTRQKVQASCENCNVTFGKYTCLICNLFDDEDKKQYHCDGCGICRVGGRDRFFHCERCNMCLPEQLQIVGHRCVENVSRANCPVCLEDIHTSRIPCHIPDCGHLLHRPCFEQLLHSGHYACPTCQTSMIDMHNLWSYLDSEVAATPMPAEYANYKATILCKDCHKLSAVKFHVVGLKCQHCGAYNTCQTGGFHKEGTDSQTQTDARESSSSSGSSSRSGAASATLRREGTDSQTQTDAIESPSSSGSSSRSGAASATLRRVGTDSQTQTDASVSSSSSGSSSRSGAASATLRRVGTDSQTQTDASESPSSSGSSSRSGAASATLQPETSAGGQLPRANPLDEPPLA